MLEIGSSFEYDDDDYGTIDVTVGGYVYYESGLYYCCYDAENERNLDVHASVAEDICEEEEDAGDW